MKSRNWLARTVAAAIHGQIFFESFEVLALAPPDVVVIQLPGREILRLVTTKRRLNPRSLTSTLATMRRSRSQLSA